MVTPTAGATAITTYHYDNLRTGWNRGETVLTPANVRHLGLPKRVTLDEQVNAQPLFVPGVAIAGGTRNVVYVATENDSVYAIAAASGQILARRSLGTAVPALPGDCGASSGVVGIDSTPVIDRTTSTLYVMAFTYPQGRPTWTLHALDLGTLKDKTKPAVVRATATLSDGSNWRFAPGFQRQRPALLEASGNIYAGFGSFCDLGANLSRGWLLGWQARSLTPFAANHLTNKLIPGQSPHDFFLSAIWMSGAGPAADAAGNVYFVTGNSDYSGTTYSPTDNLSESVVKMSPNLTKVLSYFTPTGWAGVDVLDRADGDFGSGGVLLLPVQAGQLSLATAAGKVGQMYLLDPNHLGGHRHPNAVLGAYSIGYCWCSESYFTGSDGVGRIVSSGGIVDSANVNKSNFLTIWKLQTSPVSLVLESQFMLPGSVQDPGFFTTVSSHGTSNAIIWAIGRPVDNSPANVMLYAFDPKPADGNGSGPLFSAVAGTWPLTISNANIVPVVANGRVYVASYKELAIFDLSLPNAAQPPAAAAPRAAIAPPAPAQLPPNRHQIFGTIKAVVGSDITLATRTGKLMRVDVADAVRQHLSIVLLVGEPVIIFGSYNGSNTLHATSVQHAKQSPKGWPADR